MNIRYMRLLVFAMLFMRGLAFSQGQDERRRAEELLSSPSLTEQAWGAYLAGNLHDDSLDALLIGRLSEAQMYRDSEFATEEHAYVLALFDALIQSGKAVPADRVMPFREGWRDEALILLAREQGNEELLLSMRDEKLKEPQWLTVNNLLLRLRSPRFFAKTLEELHISHQFTVVDHNQGGFGGGSGGGGVRDGVITLPKDFPPIGLYQLIEFAEEAAVLVAKGPRNVYYRRTVVPTNGQAGWGVPFSDWDDPLERLEYLAALNETTTDAARRLFWGLSEIFWHDAADFSNQIEVHLEQQAAAIQAFATAAAQRGLGSVAGMKLTIIPAVLDRRENATLSLPLVAPKEFVLQ